MGPQRSLWRSLRHAFRGLALAARTEANFQIHLLGTTIAFALMVLLPISIVESLFVLGAITAVLVLELVNIALERLVDIMKPRIHFYAGVVKDVMAAAVLIVSLGALLVGVLVFVPHLLQTFAS